MTPQEIKAELIRRGISQTQIARSIQVTPGAINNVIHGLKDTERIRQAIADAIERSLYEVWPKKSA
jgi:lambda repressor-like predicted transcriptional regulator